MKNKTFFKRYNIKVLPFRWKTELHYVIVKTLIKLIYNDAEKAGGKIYAEICSAAYRQVISAHKLFTDKEGNLMWFSKENNSNCCINTVDLPYPSAPLFLVYNPDLQKAMMTSIFEYSASGRWDKPFAAHDLGTIFKDTSHHCLL